MAPPSHARPVLGEIDQTIITLKVGLEGKLFMIHKESLCQQSPYFKAAFKDHWKEGQDNAMTLDETDPEIFTAFVMDWFYTGQAIDDDDALLVKAYIFADRYDVPGLREAIIDTLYEGYTTSVCQILPKYEDVIQTFECLPATSKLCRLFLDLYAKFWEPGYDSGEEKSLREELPTSFILPLMIRLGKRPRDKVPLLTRDDYKEQVGEDAPASCKKQDK